MTAYLCLRCRIPEGLEEELPEILAPLSVLGCQVEAEGPSASRLSVYLAASDAAAAGQLAGALEAAGARDLTCHEAAEEDWLAGYRAAAQPFAIGSLWWVDPQPGSSCPVPPGRIRLLVEPRTAFGSGSHESTQLVLLELENGATPEVARSLSSVLDVGTGSGILALAAERLGGSWVVGVDLDPEAVWVARQIARQQEWEASSRFVVGSLESVARCRFKLILCNMISERFLPLLGDIHRLLDRDGEVILSGMLCEQLVAMRASLAAAGLRVVGKRRLGDWLCLRARRE